MEALVQTTVYASSRDNEDHTHIKPVMNILEIPPNSVLQ